MRSKSTLHVFQKTFSSSSADPWVYLRGLEDDSPGGRQEFMGAVCEKRPSRPDLGVRTSRSEGAYPLVGPLPVVRSLRLGYKDLLDCFEDIFSIGSRVW